MRIVAKSSEIIDTKKPTESTEFASQEKFEEAGYLAVSFEKRFPAQPPFPIHPRNISESPKFANQEKTISQLRLIDWEWIRMVQERSIEKDKIKRAEARAQQLEKVAELDAHAFEIYQMEAQKFRIFMTWLERVRATKRHRELRIKNQLLFQEEIQDNRSRTREFSRIENFLVRRKKGLESPIPPPPVKFQVDEVRREVAIREKIQDQRNVLHEFLRENIRLAQAQVANVLLKKALLENHEMENEKPKETAESARYKVHKAKPKK